MNGYGLLIGKSGAAYAASFKDNMAQSRLMPKECQGDVSADWTSCIGTYRYADGNIYRGEFAHGRPDGIGLLQVNATRGSDVTRMGRPAAGVYVGQFKDGKPSGRGAVMMSGAGYVGTSSGDAFKPRAAKSARKGRRPGVVTDG